MVSVAIVLGLVLAFCFGTSDYLSKGLTGKVGFYRTTVYTLAVSGVFAIAPTLLLGIPRQPSFSDAAILALVALSTFIAFLFMYRGYQKGHLSIVSPTVNSFPIFSVIIAVFVLKVSLSLNVLLALAGVILGILLVSTNFSSLGSSKGRRLTPGVPEAILAAFFFAVTFTSLGYADLTVGYLFPVMGALEAAGILAFTLALFYTSTIAILPITTTLGGMGVVFTVGLALIFLKERVEPSYAVGAMVLIASVAALLYFTA